jgi:hypothetical protein
MMPPCWQALLQSPTTAVREPDRVPRLPVGLGGLAVEAEAVDKSGARREFAAEQPARFRGGRCLRPCWKIQQRIFSYADCRQGAEGIGPPASLAPADEILARRKTEIRRLRCLRPPTRAGRDGGSEIWRAAAMDREEAEAGGRLLTECSAHSELGRSDGWGATALLRPSLALGCFFRRRSGM